MPQTIILAEDIDLKDKAIQERYSAIIHKSPDWSQSEKRRIIALREISRLDYEASLEKASVITEPFDPKPLKARITKLEDQMAKILEAIK